MNGSARASMAPSIPRYIQISDLFRQRIARGQWKVGDQLPTLDVLVEDLNVSRVTIRQAIDVLSHEGLVTPQQGRGTFVTAAPKIDHWLKVETTLADLTEVYQETKPEILNIAVSTLQPTLEDGEGWPADDYCYMHRVHRRDGRPYCVIDIYLAGDIYRKSPRRFRDETVITVLKSLRSVKIDRARQTLSISTADVEVANLLGIPVNSPIANVRRVFTDAEGRVIYLGLVVYRGDYIRLEMDLKP